MPSSVSKTQEHIANHLLELALMSLPWRDDIDIVGEDGNNSRAYSEKGSRQACQTERASRDMDGLPSCNFDEDTARSENDGPSIIKCICGFDNGESNTIFCEGCETSQHIECYYHSKETPEVHSCINCEPRILNGKLAWGWRRQLRKPGAIEIEGRKTDTTQMTEAKGHDNSEMPLTTKAPTEKLTDCSKIGATVTVPVKPSPSREPVPNHGNEIPEEGNEYSGEIADFDMHLLPSKAPPPPTHITGGATSPGSMTAPMSMRRLTTHKCALCTDGIVYFTTRGALKRHVHQQHQYSAYIYECPAAYNTVTACTYRHTRKYKTKKHIVDRHPDMMNLEPIRINEELYPQNCSLCPHAQHNFSSWNLWWQHFESHCRIPIDSAQMSSQPASMAEGDRTPAIFDLSKMGGAPYLSPSSTTRNPTLSPPLPSPTTRNLSNFELGVSPFHLLEIQFRDESTRPPQTTI